MERVEGGARVVVRLVEYQPPRVGRNDHPRWRWIVPEFGIASDGWSCRPFVDALRSVAFVAPEAVERPACMRRDAGCALRVSRVCAGARRATTEGYGRSVRFTRFQRRTRTL